MILWSSLIGDNFQIAREMTQTHLSEELLVSKPVSEEQDVRVPALLWAPPKVLPNSQGQIPCIMTEPQQARPVCPNLGQTCWWGSQRVGWAAKQQVD